MKIVTIPCLQDNFAYLLICTKTQQAAVVDPSEAAPVISEIERQGVKLTTILNTHHHWDHVDGNQELIAKYPGLIIYGHASDRGRIPGQTEFLKMEMRSALVKRAELFCTIPDTPPEP